MIQNTTINNIDAGSSPHTPKIIFFWGCDETGVNSVEDSQRTRKERKDVIKDCEKKGLKSISLGHSCNVSSLPQELVDACVCQFEAMFLNETSISTEIVRSYSCSRLQRYTSFHEYVLQQIIAMFSPLETLRPKGLSVTVIIHFS